MPDLMRHLRTLAQEIGPRPSTKEGERRAGEYIASVFKTCGLAVERMPFRSVPSFSYAYGVIFLGALISVGLLFAGHPLLAAFLSALCVVVFYLENSSFETVSRLLAWGRSQNILGKIPPKIPSPPVGEAGPPCREALQGELRGLPDWPCFPEVVVESPGLMVFPQGELYTHTDLELLDISLGVLGEEPCPSIQVHDHHPYRGVRIWNYPFN